MDCRSDKCYQNHKQVPVHIKGKFKGKRSGPSQCQKWWKCPTCYNVIRVDKRKKEDHECGEYLCSSCDKYVMDEHLCYLRATSPKENFIPKFMFLTLSVARLRKWNVRKVTNPKERKIVKIVNRNRYVNLAPNVKPLGAIKPRIVRTLSWLIPSALIVLISP